MSKAKHTPGPWTARLDFGRQWIAAGKGKKVIQVADVSDIEIGAGSGEVDVDLATTKANARLIAAAPDLLAACKKALYCLTAEQEESWMESQSHPESPYHFLWLAVAKAKNQSPPSTIKE